MDQVRDWFTTYDADLARVRRFWQGEGRYLVSVQTTKHAYRQVFQDAVVLDQAVLNLKAQAKLPGVNLPSFFADWGTVSTAKYWGGTVHFDSTGANLFVDPVAQTLDDALTLAPLPVDDPTMDAHHGLCLFRQLRDYLGTDALWLRPPDMQGPLNTAGLVVNQEELLMAMYTEPDKVHAFLDKVSDFLIEYAMYFRRETQGQVCGNIWPYTFFPADLGLSLTEDLMPLLSAETYQVFGIPYLQKLQAALGDLHIHCCGEWGRHAPYLKAADLRIAAVEFHYPATTLEELACLADDVVFIPYILLHKQDMFETTTEYYRYLIEETDPRYRFWFACADDSSEMLTFAEKWGGNDEW